MPCWRGSGPIAFCCLAEMPSTTNSANEPCASGTPSAAYRAPDSERADRTITCSTSRTDSSPGDGEHRPADLVEHLILVGCGAGGGRAERSPT